MSCQQCKLHQGGFKTEDEFIQFEKKINNLIKSGQLEELARKDNSRFFESRFRCNTCNAVWILSYPDQAYRGDWREE